MGRGARLDHMAGVHDDALVARLGHHRQVVRDEDEREVELPTQTGDEVEDLRLHHHVEGRGRLVADHELRVAGQGHGDHGALAHAARELVWVVVDALGIDAHEVKELAGTLHRLGVAHALVQHDRLGDLLAGRAHRVESVHGSLEDDRDLLPADLAHAVLGAFGQVAAVEEDVTRDDLAVLGQQLEDRQGGRRLAAARLAGQAQALARLDDEADAVDGLHPPIRQLEVGLELTNVQ